MIIAIDGPAASGKGTLGKRLAAHYRLRHLDTGLIYRAVALTLLDRGQPLDDLPAAVAAAKVLEPSQFDEARLKVHAVGEAASRVSVIPEVREALLAFQRDFGRTPPGAVLDGRDIGTVIFPDAEAKIFVTATPEVRARRRALEIAGQRQQVEEAEVLADIQPPRRARHAAHDRPAETRARCTLARYHPFGYRRRIPGRRRHCRSRPNGPGTRTTAFPSWRLSPFARRFSRRCFFDGRWNPNHRFDRPANAPGRWHAGKLRLPVSRARRQV